MKKSNLKYAVIAAAASALLIFSGCGEAAEAPAGASPAAAAAQEERAGALLLSVNPAIEMEYDTAGDVLTLTGLNDDARSVLKGYDSYYGRPVSDVAAELVGEIDEGGYFDAEIAGHERNIVLKLERGSEHPEGFLTEVETAVRDAVSSRGVASKPVALDEDDYDARYADRGYISAEAAERLVAEQTGISGENFVVKEYEIDDGDYEIEAIVDGVEYEFEVDAYTGRVTEVERDDGDDRYDDDRYGDDWYDDDRWDDDDWYDDDRWDDDDWYDDDDWDDDDDDDWDDDDDDWDDDDDDDDDDDWDDDWDD